MTMYDSNPNALSIPQPNMAVAPIQVSAVEGGMVAQNEVALSGDFYSKMIVVNGMSEHTNSGARQGDIAYEKPDGTWGYTRLVAATASVFLDEPVAPWDDKNTKLCPMTRYFRSRDQRKSGRFQDPGGPQNKAPLCMSLNHRQCLQPDGHQFVVEDERVPANYVPSEDDLEFNQGIIPVRSYVKTNAIQCDVCQLGRNLKINGVTKGNQRPCSEVHRVVLYIHGILGETAHPEVMILNASGGASYTIWSTTKFYKSFQADNKIMSLQTASQKTGVMVPSMDNTTMLQGQLPVLITTKPYQTSEGETNWTFDYHVLCDVVGGSDWQRFISDMNMRHGIDMQFLAQSMQSMNRVVLIGDQYGDPIYMGYQEATKRFNEADMFHRLRTDGEHFAEAMKRSQEKFNSDNLAQPQAPTMAPQAPTMMGATPMGQQPMQQQQAPMGQQPMQQQHQPAPMQQQQPVPQQPVPQQPTPEQPSTGFAGNPTTALGGMISNQ